MNNITPEDRKRAEELYPLRSFSSKQQNYDQKRRREVHLRACSEKNEEIAIVIEYFDLFKKEGYRYDKSSGHWYNIVTDNSEIFTTSELYQLYKQQKG